MTKHLLQILTVMFLALVPAVADAAEYKVDIDKAANVEFDINGTIVANVTDGINLIDMGGERYLRVIAKNGVLFTDVTKVDTYYDEEIPMLGQIETLPDGRKYIDLSTSFPEDEYFRIRTSSEGDARDASCTITIDNPAKAIVTLAGNPLELVQGSNSIQFSSKTENTLEIMPADRPLYSVTHNGTALTTPYRYTIALADGDEINITANYPDKDCAVKFALTGSGANDFITEVDVNGRPEFNWRAEGFTVKAGSELSLKGNTTEFEVLEFKVNGRAEAFTNPTKLFITEDTEISVSVRKYASFEMTVRVDDPSRVHIYRGYSYNGDELQLTAGDNIVEITRNTPIISLVPADGSYINTLRIADYEYTVEELQRAPVMVGSLSDDDVLDVTTGTIVRDKNAIVFMHNLAAATGYFKLLRADLSEITIAEGYNPIQFYDRDNAFRFETGGPAVAQVFVNDAAIEPEPGGYNYCPTLADGDVVKVFFDFTPAAHSLTIEASDETLNDVAITRDQIVPLQAGTFTALTHTLVRIAPKGDAIVSVSADGTPLEASADGSFCHTVTADTHIAVTSSTSGITDIDADSNGATTVYNLQGIQLNTPLHELPAGIYIVNGHKIMKR